MTTFEFYFWLCVTLIFAGYVLCAGIVELFFNLAGG